MREHAVMHDLLQVDQAVCLHAGQPVVDSASFGLNSGQIGCLLGPSGSGKTTLLRAIAGLHPLDSGHIYLRGRQADQLAPEKRKLGFVFQDLALFPHLDVLSNVGFGLDHLSDQQKLERQAQVIAMLGLSGLEPRYAHELSGGQQQRVALARSLAPQPDLLLLDECFSSLDADLRGRLRDDLRAALKTLGVTALLVTHDQEEAFAFADMVGVMRDGQLLQWSSGFDLYHKPSDPFVAEFVGEGRFLPATVLDAHRIACAIGEFKVRQSLQQIPGTQVRVLIRPDDIAIDKNASIEAVITHVGFRGAETMHKLRLADGTELSSFLPSHDQHQIGDAVRIRTDMEHVVVFD